jgi:hypothetical protein
MIDPDPSSLIIICTRISYLLWYVIRDNVDMKPFPEFSKKPPLGSFRPKFQEKGVKK